MLLKLIDFLRKEDYSEFPYKGIVVLNEDEGKNLGRIKVKIQGLIESSDNTKLPYIFPINSYGLGGRPDLSSFSVPEIDSEVQVIFPYNDIYSGFYTGYWQSSSTHQTLFDVNYPESYGWIDSVIQWLKINKSEPSVEYYRKTLSDMLRLDKEGSLSINIPKDLVVKIGGNASLDITGNVNIKNGGNYSEDVGGAHGLKTGSTHGVQSGGDISHEAPNIWHNSGHIYGTVATGDAELAGYITTLDAKLAELGSLAIEIETLRDTVKDVLSAKADTLKGD